MAKMRRRTTAILHFYVIMKSHVLESPDLLSRIGDELWTKMGGDGIYNKGQHSHRGHCPGLLGWESSSGCRDDVKAFTSCPQRDIILFAAYSKLQNWYLAPTKPSFILTKMITMTPKSDDIGQKKTSQIYAYLECWTWCRQNLSCILNFCNIECIWN